MYSYFIAFLILVLFGLIAVTFNGLAEEGAWSNPERYVDALKTIHNLYTKNDQELNEQKCKLPQYSPWDESIMKHYNQLYGYQKPCNNEKFRTTLTLRDGKLVKKSKDDNCWGRCLYWDGDWSHKAGSWRNDTSPYDCDVIEARCSSNGTIQDYDYSWIHTQIYEDKELKKKLTKPKNSTFDILLLLLDSTSYTQSFRNFGKTVTYLTNGLNGVPFPYLNRVGANTKPNLFSLFFGAIPEMVDRSMFNEPSFEETLNPDKMCKYALDNITSLQKEFEGHGYVTSFFEDWFSGWSNYPNCVGTKKKATHHINSPFRMAWQEGYDKNSGKVMKEQKFCTSKHQAMFDHVGQFLNSYPGIPKMATLMDTNLGHDDVSSSLEADMIMYDFFIKNRKKLENSFIFLMGDHGLRFGQVAGTTLGLLEINNPMLYVVPPKVLTENNDLMATLRKNSLKLQSHHDVRETILDILKYQPATNFTDRTPAVNGSTYGSSFLRSQFGERSCWTLPIPFQYCMCQYAKEEQNLNATLSKRIGETVTENVNNHLSSANLSSKCHTWSFEKVLRLTKLDVIDTLDIYEVEVSAQPNAKFRTMVSDFRNGTLLVGKVDRSDSYGKRGDCVEESYRRLCECKTKSNTKT